jgi:prolyl-tRNA synthetase
MEKIHTPNFKTIEEITNFLKLPATAFVKTILYSIDGNVVGVMVRGDREINETKLQNLFDATEVVMAGFEQVERVTGAAVGFAGPVGLKEQITMVADLEVGSMANFVVGANETDYHLMNVNIMRDFKPAKIADIRNIIPGDPCPVCGSPMAICRGIEVGHIFKLGTKYSEALGCNFLDQAGNENPMIMGSYGIGVGRTLAAVIEQHYDEFGIIWPMEVAPYQVIVVPTNTTDETINQLAAQIHDDLEKRGVEVLLDDRDERPGVKFKDADLIGIPVRITIGRKAAEGIVELKLRASKDNTEMTPAEAVNKVIELAGK